jgi:alkanesulfonate monooxygenase
MTLRLHWFLPGHGDGREVAKSADGSGFVAARGPRREPEIEYLGQVAQAADRLGFHGALVPFGLFCEDPWLVSAALAGQTRRLRFMVAVRPGLTEPTLIAQQSATLQRLTGGRLLLNVVTGSDADEQRRYGDLLDHDERYARTGEFLDVLGRAWAGGDFDFTGAHYRITGGRLARPYPLRPTVFVGGSSPAAQRVAAAYADVFLCWGEPPPAVAGLVKQVRERAEESGRRLAFGTRLHVIARDSEREAWDTARALVAGMDPEVIARAQRRFAASESVGQRRAAALHQGGTGDLTVYPNLWAGYGLVRPGTGLALVGSHEQVAERIAEYHALGLDHLILSGQPHLEEAYAFGEGVLPLLRERGILADGSTVDGTA